MFYLKPRGEGEPAGGPELVDGLGVTREPKPAPNPLKSLGREPKNEPKLAPAPHRYI